MNKRQLFRFLLVLRHITSDMIVLSLLTCQVALVYTVVFKPYAAFQTVFIVEELFPVLYEYLI